MVVMLVAPLVREAFTTRARAPEWHAVVGKGGSELGDPMSFLPALGLSANQYRAVLLEITNDQDQRASLLEDLGDPWWKEVLLLYAGQTADAGLLLQRLCGLLETTRYALARKRVAEALANERVSASMRWGIASAWGSLPATRNLAALL
jgi:hypothetical protein